MSKERLDPPREPWETAQYEDDPFELGDIGERKFKIVAKDFLPRWQKPTAQKVTMALDDFAIETFKGKAQELGGSYQAMMRRLLYEYARTLKAEEMKVKV